MLVRNYIKRQCMEVPLSHIDLPDLPRGVELIPWSPELMEAHAEVNWLSFRQSIDATVFPNLGNFAGCIYLMREIASHADFLPAATWLAKGSYGDFGCIQGIAAPGESGMIQNLAVIPESRGRGIGKALLAAALQGFQRAGLKTAQLEVSTRNKLAVSMYHRAGFQIRKTYYREVRSEFAEYAI